MSWERKSKRFYWAHKASSKQRGIPFLLSYDEWLSIWEKSGYHLKRGEYVMSRIGDQGAYEVGNILIQTGSKNGKDANIGYPAVWDNQKISYAIFLFCKGTKITEIASIVGRPARGVKIKIYRSITLSRWQAVLEKYPGIGNI